MTRRRLHLLLGGCVAAVALPLAVNPSLHLRADAMSNTAIAHAILRHGIPPPDPYLAGQPLQYHWAYNAVAAGLSRLTGVEPLPIMVWLGPVALAVMLVAGARLARRLGGGDEGAALAAVLAVVGLNGWGWAFLAARWATGQVTPSASLDAGVRGFLPLVVWGYDVRLGFFATKMLVATSFAWCLAFLALAAGALVRFLDEGRTRQGVAFALAAAGASCATAHVGAGLLGLAVAGLAATLCLRKRLGEAAAPRRAAAALGFAGLGIALAAPYLLLVSGASAARERLVWLALPDGFHLAGAACCLAPLAVCVALAGRPRRAGLLRLWLVFLAAGFAGAFLVVRVVDGVQTKFLFAAAMLLAFYVGSVAGELGPRRRRLVWAVAASAVPTTLFGLMAYARAPDTIGLSPSEAAAFEWLARNAAPDAVVVARHRSTLVPVLARRDLYVPDRPGFHRAARYDPAVWARRTEQMRRLFERGEAAAVLGEIEAELRRPVFLLVRAGEASAGRGGLRELFSAGDIRVLALDEPREAGR